MSRSCRQLREDLLAYVEAVQFGRDGASAEERGEISAHLETCDACRSEAERIKATLLCIRQAPSLEVPENLAVLVSEAVQKPKPKRLFILAPALAFASTVLILLAVSVWMFKGESNVEVAAPRQTARLSELLEEQQRWLLILSHTLKEEEEEGKEELHQASYYVLSRMSRSTAAFREAIQQGGIAPEEIPKYERTLEQQTELLKEFYFGVSSS